VLNHALNADQYHLYDSRDGLSFNHGASFSSNEYTLTGLSPDSVVYIKLASENADGLSADTEVLAALPKITAEPKMLMVYGFDRTSAGNTFNYIRQHASAAAENGAAFESASNEAVLNGLFYLTDYTAAAYILGDESTVDETFSSSEQSLVSAFLKGGGRLFVSGAEIAWDLDYRGSSSDKAFFHDYFKAAYSADAPGGVSGTHYSAMGTQGGIFESIDPINFDNGTHGTLNIKWADALTPLGGSKEIITYKNVTSHSIGGISFEGTFKGSSKPGKLVYMGFPFETIYPAETRNIMMDKILDFLYSDASSLDKNELEIPEAFSLSQNYPNPFNPKTVISYQLPVVSNVELSIYNILGQEIETLVSKKQPAGSYKVEWDAAGLASGVYSYRIKTDNGFIHYRKMLLQK